MPSPTAVQITLTNDERTALEAWTSCRKTAQALALRARIVLAAAGQLTNREIAALEGVSPPTVTKWRNRFAERRLEGLLDEPRPGRPRTITNAEVEAIVIKTLESAPRDATHWSTRSMARVVGIAPGSVRFPTNPTRLLLLSWAQRPDLEDIIDGGARRPRCRGC